MEGRLVVPPGVGTSLGGGTRELSGVLGLFKILLRAGVTQVQDLVKLYSKIEHWIPWKVPPPAGPENKIEPRLP